ncbi:MAG: tetratricopeptide repeat protein [Thermogutta sp.]
MRAVNKRFALLLLAALILMGIGAYFLHGFQIRRNAKVFLARAQKAKAQEQFDVAVKNYQWYVELVPDDLDALAEYASLLVDLRAYGPAYFRLEALLRLDPGRVESRRKLVQVLLAMGRLRDAQEHLQQYLLKETPDDAELLTQLGWCQRGLGQYEQATTTFRRAIELKPDYVPAYAQLAGTYRHDLKQPEQGDEWITKMVLAAGDSLEAFSLAASYFYTAKNYEAAFKWAEEATNKDSANSEMMIIAADSLRRLERWDEAEKYSQRAIALAPERADAYTVHAAIQSAKGEQVAAIQILEEAAVKVKDRGPIYWTLAGMYIDAGRFADAERTIKDLEGVSYPPAQIEFLRGRLLVAQQQWFLAARKLESVRPDVTDSPDLLKQVDLLLGLCYGQLGNLDQAVSAYSKAMAQDPLWPQARLGRAIAYLELGRLEEAVNEYRNLVQLGRASPQIVLEFTRLLVLSYLNRPPQQRNWQEVNQWLTELEKDDKTKADATILRAEILVAEKQTEEAEKLLTASFEQSPKEDSLGLALVSLRLQSGRFSEAEQLLDQIEKESGQTLGILLSRARLAVRRTDEKLAKEKLLSIASAGKKLPKEDYQRLLSTLITYAIQFSDFDNARRWTQELAQLSPNTLRVQLLLFDLVMQARDVAGLGKVLDDIARIEGKGPIWHYGEAIRLYLEAKGENRTLLQQALDHLSRAGTLRPNWMRVPALQGQICDLLGDPGLATTYYLRAVSLGDRRITTARRLVQLLYSQQRFLEADQVIRKLEEQQAPFSPDLDRLASDISLRLEDYERAVELARRAASQSNDYRDHVWYGTVQSVLGLRARAEPRANDAQQLLAEAEKEFRKGVELAPESVDAWVALVQFYARVQEKEKTQQAIAEAQEKIKGGIAPIAMAQVYEVLGNLDEAEKQYQEAIKIAPDDPRVVRQVTEFYLRTGRTESARVQLERITSGDVKATESDLFWGRRAIALILAAQGGYENLQKGLQLIRQNRAAGGAATIQDLRAEALLLTAHPQRKKRLEGRDLLEKVLAESPEATADDRFVLAQLYMADGDVVNAARHMRSLLAARGDDARYLGTYVSFLLDQSQLAEAEAWQVRLEKVAPEAFTTLALRARLLTAQGRYDQAIQRLQEFAEKEPPSASSDVSPSAGSDQTKDEASAVEDGTAPAEQLSRVQQLRWALAGDALESLGRTLERSGKNDEAKRYFDEAEKLYRRFVEKNPEARLLLASFLARHGKPQEGLEIFETAWETSELSLVRAAAQVFFGIAPEDRTITDRVEAIVAKALEQHQRPLSLLLVLGDAYGIQGRLADSEAIYREVLQRDPRNVIALNNLSVILAMEGRNLEEAERLVRTALDSVGPAGNLLDSYAIVLIARNKPTEALKVLAEAIEDQPLPVLFLRQAQACELLGQTEAAGNAFREAIKRGLKRESLHPIERRIFDRFQNLISQVQAGKSS